MILSLITTCVLFFDNGKAYKDWSIFTKKKIKTGQRNLVSISDLSTVSGFYK